MAVRVCSCGCAWTVRAGAYVETCWFCGARDATPVMHLTVPNASGPNEASVGAVLRL